MNIETARTKFKIGVVVEITNTGEQYSNYQEWAKEHLGYEEFAQWKNRTGKKFCVGAQGVVLCLFPEAIEGVCDPDASEEETILSVCIPGDGVYLMATGGVSTVYGSKRKISEEDALHAIRVRYTQSSKVVIDNTGATYSSYESWVDRHLLYSWKQGWKERKEMERGDVGTIIAVHQHGGFEDEYIAAVSIAGKGIHLMNVRGIVPYKEDNTLKADTEEKKKVCDYEPGSSVPDYTLSLDGHNVVIWMNGVKVSRSIEDVVSELVIEAKANQIKVGDLVEITDAEECYSIHERWLEENLSFAQALRFQWDRIPDTGDTGTVIMIGEDDNGRTMYLINVEYDFDAHYFLFDHRGIKKI